jgi:hypothetical protein
LNTLIPAHLAVRPRLAKVPSELGFGETSAAAEVNAMEARAPARRTKGAVTTGKASAASAEAVAGGALKDAAPA